jgi:RNA polymerase sigma-70 factor (ECF subfamily)
VPERQAILLFVWEELSYEEIADATGVPVGTVRSRLNRARARLAATVDNEPAVPTASSERSDQRRTP